MASEFERTVYKNMPPPILTPYSNETLHEVWKYLNSKKAIGLFRDVTNTTDQDNITVCFHFAGLSNKIWTRILKPEVSRLVHVVGFTLYRGKEEAGTNVQMRVRLLDTPQAHSVVD
jgi:hypothetical protein